MIDIKEISENIRKYRRIAGLTQAALAEKMFVVAQTVSKWERGLSVPSIAELSQIGDILGVSISELLSETQCARRDVMIAVDGGGTKTEILLFSEDGELKRALTSGSNPNVIGTKAASEVICAGIDSLICDDMRVSTVFCGIAGAGVKDNARIIQSDIKRKYPSAKVVVKSDISNVIGLADNPENCIAVIMGTGSSVFSSSGSEICRVGGWGYMFDRAGSGYDIGREVIRHTLAFEDGMGEDSEVVRMCRARLGEDAYSMIPELHSKGVNYIASFAQIAFDAARGGDAVALDIIKTSTDRVCDLITHAMKKTGQNPDIIMSGGLLAGGDVILPLIEKRLLGQSIKIPKQPQIIGAVRMCITLSGADVNLEQIKEKYGEITK